MRKCWEADPSRRSRFPEISSNLDFLLASEYENRIMPKKWPYVCINLILTCSLITHILIAVPQICDCPLLIFYCWSYASLYRFNKVIIKSCVFKITLFERFFSVYTFGPFMKVAYVKLYFLSALTSKLHIYPIRWEGNSRIFTKSINQSVNSRVI